MLNVPTIAYIPILCTLFRGSPYNMFFISKLRVYNYLKYFNIAFQLNTLAFDDKRL